MLLFRWHFLHLHTGINPIYFWFCCQGQKLFFLETAVLRGDAVAYQRVWCVFGPHRMATWRKRPFLSEKDKILFVSKHWTLTPTFKICFYCKWGDMYCSRTRRPNSQVSALEWWRCSEDTNSKQKILEEWQTHNALTFYSQSLLGLHNSISIFSMLMVSSCSQKSFYVT